MHRRASSLSWSMGHIARAWERQMNKWVKYINEPTISIEKLTLGITTRDAVTKLKTMCNEAALDDLSELLNLVAMSRGDTFAFLSNITQLDNNSRFKKNVLEYLRFYYYMADQDEDFSAVH